MLREYWRLRSRYSRWSGYKPGSGIMVTEVAPRNSSAIVVMVRPERELQEMNVLDVGQDVYLAPLIEGDGPSQRRKE